MVYYYHEYLRDASEPEVKRNKRTLTKFLDDPKYMHEMTAEELCKLMYMKLIVTHRCRTSYASFMNPYYAIRSYFLYLKNKGVAVDMNVLDKLLMIVKDMYKSAQAKSKVVKAKTAKGIEAIDADTVEYLNNKIHELEDQVASLHDANAKLSAENANLCQDLTNIKDKYDEERNKNDVLGAYPFITQEVYYALSADNGIDTYTNYTDNFVHERCAAYHDICYAEKAQKLRQFNDMLLAFKWCNDRDMVNIFNTNDGVFTVYYDNVGEKWKTSIMVTALSNEVTFSSEAIAEKCAKWLDTIDPEGSLLK